LTETEIALVRAANQAFYDAFEARDIDAMSDVWEHSDRVACTHPGWRTLHGWGEVSASWFALFRGPQELQFILTEDHIAVIGDLAWVTVDENLIGSQGGGTVAAVNLFARTADGWRMVLHHGSAVAPVTSG
jgi:ketosteroid isomerase-like protein